MESPRLSPVATAFNGSNSSNLSEPSSPNTRSRSSSRSSLRLDLSNLPPLTQPTKPTNTLLITNLQNPEIFHPESLQNIRNIIATHANVLTWSPLKSFKRIICSFPSEDEAIVVRQALDGSTIMGDRVRVYFGETTPIEPGDQHLHLPDAKKLFFISPPPSPPRGWEVKDEEPPNAQILAEDLADALSKLRAKNRGSGGIEGESTDDKMADGEGLEVGVKQICRTRSGSVMLFEPEKKNETHMPSISVDDFSDGESSGTVPQSPTSPTALPKATVTPTSRPPVELMDTSA
ncbi:Calcipressin-domain-containing protein [Terfezia boudieri ATCC MYA-4762]|uniref:Calcipressin-domain-containing protein n=1 Tax=Terfezia boudieri ATCC MYA-4762 TaxID=1051890 RepID=A0A3N4LYM4_9PEZI|nr:Calcipressin-domain-containing protein [Terfezia boudieri ATCC MYA-4762]